MLMIQGRSSSLSVFFVTGGCLLAVSSSLISRDVRPKALGIPMALDDGRGTPDDRGAGDDEMRRGLLWFKEILVVDWGR